MKKNEFRAWSPKFDRMIYADNEEFTIDVAREKVWCDAFDDESITLLQHIGLPDKTGQKIFEGDLCRSHRPNTYLGDMNDLYEIIFLEDYAMFCFKCVGSDNDQRIGRIPMTRGNHPYFITSKLTTVVGNIFENSEML